MAINFKRIWQGLGLVPKTSSTADSQGELEVLSTDSKLRYHNGTSSSPVLTEAHSATVTNKGIDADNNTISNLEVDNLKAGVLNTDTGLAGASDTQVPSALAVKTYVDNSSGAVQADVDDLITLSGVPANSTDLGTFTGTTIPDSSTVKSALQSLETQVDTNTTDISNKVTGPASSIDNHIVRFDGTTGKLIQDGSPAVLSDAGALSGLTGISSSGTAALATVTASGSVGITGGLDANGTIAYASVNDAATGSNVTLTAPTTKVIRLTGASLSSIDGIPSGSDAQEIILENVTGSTITINNDTGATAANRILTGTGANLTLANTASVTLSYDITASRWRLIGGSGSGSSSGINYILNSDAEAGTTGWATYADAAGTIPVDGTGGAPNVTLAASTSSPLRGVQSFLFTKDAANRQGQGASYDFTIDRADMAKILTISMDYEVSANYVDVVSGNLFNSDMQVFVYDVTNAQLIYCSSQNIAATTTEGSLVTQFQTASNSTSYRLIFHVASTNANAYTLEFDNVQVGPKPVIKGAVVTDWQSTVSVIGATTTPPTKATVKIVDITNYRRVGSDMEITYTYTHESSAGSAAGSGTYLFPIPEGRTIDLSKITNGNTLGDQQYVVGVAGFRNGASSAEATGFVQVYNSQNLSIQILLEGGGALALWSSSATPFTGGSYRVSFSARVPILGWSSNLQLSEDSGNREVSFRVQKSVAQTGVNPNNSNVKVTWDQVLEDTTASFDTSTSEYVIPESGEYVFGADLITASTNILASGYALNWFVDGSFVRSTGLQTAVVNTNISKSSTVKFKLTKGQRVYVAFYGAGNNSSSTISINATISSSFWGYKVASPQTLAGSETVAAKYLQSSGQAVTDNTNIVFDTLVFDTHNAYNTSTGNYVIPSSGIYMVSVSIRTAAVVAAVGNALAINVRNNSVGSEIGPQDVCQNTASRQYSAIHSTCRYYNKGDVLTARFAETLPAVNLDTSTVNNQITIVKVG